MTRAAGRTPPTSVIRDILAMAQRPELVSLAGGVPDVTLLDRAPLTEALIEAAASDAALGYGVSEGDELLRTTLDQRVRLPRGADDVIVTTGSQQGLDLLVRALVSPGDTVLVERPCYPAMLQLLAAAEAHVVDVACDDQGMCPDALADALAREEPVAVYLVPTFHNPTGATQSPARRRKLLAVLATHGTTVIEDDAYRDLWFETEPPPPLAAALPEQVAYVGSLSKCMAPGVRIGWISVPAWLRPSVLALKQGADLNTSLLVQRAVATYIASGALAAHLEVARRAYAERCRETIAALAEHLPEGSAVRSPAGGFYAWVRLPPEWNTDALFPAAIRSGVAYVPGSGFYASVGDRSTLRIAFAAEPVQRLRDGIARLGEVFQRSGGEPVSAAPW